MLNHAVNHWDLAVATHGANFPHIHVHQEDITEVTARDFGLRQIDMLWASPSCVHHSRARGGKPRDDQQRSHADEVVDRWLRVAQVDVLLVENVPEFTDWGPLHKTHSNGCRAGIIAKFLGLFGHLAGKDFLVRCKKGCHHNQPIKERKGEYFRAFLDKLSALGYRYEHRVLCAADFGDPTSRRRFFMQAVRDGRPIVWPEPTHRDTRKATGLFDANMKPWRTAAECIDWSIPVPSIFDRKRPLAPATLRRIAAGIVRYVLNGKPFIVNFRGTSEAQVNGSASGLDEPLRTVTAGIHHGLAAPILSSFYGHKSAQGDARGCALDSPVPTIPTNNRHALVAAFLAKHYKGVIGASLEAPMPTVTSIDHNALVAATMVQTGFGEREGQAPRCLDIQAPLGTVVAQGIKHGLVAATLMTNTSGHAPTDIGEQPMPALTTGNHQALVAAFITHYYSQGTTAQDPADPLHTITTLARHGLVTVEIDGETYVITDIGMRMLEPHELAKAMGFPEDYRWVDGTGKPLTKRDTVKMIGNACPVNTVAALIKAVVLQRPSAFGLSEVVHASA